MSVEIGNYRLKRISFYGRQTSVLVQSENGPCPLLALANALLLQNAVHIHEDRSEIRLGDLTTLVAEKLLEANPTNGDPNQSVAIDAAIDLLPKLQYGLDVNVRFSSPTDFEFTQEMAVFDLLGLSLYHGWVLDEQDAATAAVIRDRSYNQLVEKLVEFRALLLSPRPPAAPSPAAGATSGLRPFHASLEYAESSQNNNSTNPEIVAPFEEEAEGAAAAPAGDAAARVASEGADTTPEAAAPQEASQLPGGEEAAAAPPPVPMPEAAATDGNSESAGGASIGGAAAAEAAAAAVAQPESELAEDEAASSRARPPLPLLRPTDSADARMMQVLQEGRIIERFFADTASQLTYHGLEQLHRSVRERQICVFFRNNHFSTAFKHDGKLYLLATDLGFAREPDVVWECLDQIDGSTEYVDSDFRRVRRSQPLHVDADAAAAIAAAGADAAGVPASDYELALQLQQASDAAAAGGSVPHESLVAQDAERAFILQQQEYARAGAGTDEWERQEQRQQQQQQQQQQMSQSGRGGGGTGDLPYTERQLEQMREQERRYYAGRDARRQEPQPPVAAGGARSKSSSSSCNVM